MFKPHPFPKPHLPKQKNRITVKDLYPELSSEEQSEAEFFLTRYLEIVRRIFERTRRLTDSKDSDRV